MASWLAAAGASLYETLVATPIRAFDFVGPQILARACAAGDLAAARECIDSDGIAPTGAMLLAAARKAAASHWHTHLFPALNDAAHCPLI